MSSQLLFVGRRLVEVVRRAVVQNTFASSLSLSLSLDLSQVLLHLPDVVGGQHDRVPTVLLGHRAVLGCRVGMSRRRGVGKRGLARGWIPLQEHYRPLLRAWERGLERRLFCGLLRVLERAQKRGLLRVEDSCLLRVLERLDEWRL